MARPKKAGNQKLAIGYVRVSTDEQALGPEAQRAAIDRWAKAHDVQIVQVFEDAGISGGAPIEKRPGLMATLVALKENRAGFLVAAKRDRIARDVVIAAMIEQTVASAGATLTTADGSSDGAGPEGQLMRGIVDLFASYERGLIRARTRAALAVKKSRGERLGKVPFGYRTAADGVHMEVDPREQAIIAHVRRLRGAGVTLWGIVDDCRQNGFVSRAGKPLGLTQIARLAA